MQRILVIEDEEKTADSLGVGFAEAGFEVDVAFRGDEGLALARVGAYDIVVLDIMLPRRDGWEVLRELRRAGNHTPVICLTARDAVRDRVQGLELGADDYVVKPFAFSELVARVRTILRRATAEDPGRLAVGDLTIDLIRRRATRAGRDVDLTPKEIALLSLLVEHQGEILSRSMLASEIWGMAWDGETNVIDVAIRRLRAKVDDPFDRPLIRTVRGVGYVLMDP